MDGGGKAKAGANEPGADLSANRRRERRSYVSFPIEVSGFNREGRFFTERTSASDFGERSCAFQIGSEVELNSIVAVRCFHWQNCGMFDSRPVLFRVTRVERGSEGWMVGAVKFLPGLAAEECR